MDNLYKEIANSLPIVDLFIHYLNQYIDFYTDEPMNNTCSMTRFLKDWLIPDCCIWIYGGTQVILQHPSFDYKIQLDSINRRDFRSHRIKVSKYIE